jgi:thiol-disulfide isomerase/thioredoxin
MQTPNTAPHDELLVACLCADWCGTCRDYQATFEQMQAKSPGIQFLWIDVEDECELVDPIEVENFPTLLIATRQQVRFYGTVMPHLEILQRLIETQLAPNLSGLAPSSTLYDLAKRLWEHVSL